MLAKDEEKMENRYPNTKEWDEQKREEFLEANMKLIYSIVSKIQAIPDPAIDQDDLIQEARIAFWTAYDNYDPSRHTLFSTYVHKCMKNAINERLRAANASKRKAPLENISYDTTVSEYGDEVPGGDNMVIPDSSMSSAMPPIDEICHQKDIMDYIYFVLRTKFTAQDRYVFLSLAYKEKTQNELSKEFGCSQAKISMIYTFARITLHYELKKAGYL